MKTQKSGTRRLFLWFLLMALMFSLVLHLVVLKKASQWAVHGFSAASYDVIVPRTFRMKRVEIDPKTLEEPKKEEKPAHEVIPLTLPKEGPETEKRVTSQAEENLLQKPVPLPQEDRTMDLNPSKGLEGLVNSKDKQAMNQPVLDIPTNDISKLSTSEVREKGGDKGGAIGGKTFSSLDELLAGTASVSAATAPILMPTDLLFEYDSDTLRPEAEKTLEKLGVLIKKNEQANFKIEGHTDSFGTDEYNNALSLRRAEAVKHWLEEKMNIADSRISTVGLGKSRLLVPATGSVQQQQLNRRVEIVISTKSGK